MNHLQEFDAYARRHNDRTERYLERAKTTESVWAMTPDELTESNIQIAVINYEPFQNGEHWYRFASGSCDDSIRNDEIFLQLDHNVALRLGSTKDALTLFRDDAGITATVDLAKADRGAMLAHMIEKDSRSSASIGCDILESHNETIDGTSVRVIDKARVSEVSLVREGAHPAAFACVVDKYVPPPSLAKPSAQLNAYASLHAVKVSLDNAKHKIAAALDNRAPTKRSYTLADLNRATTCDIEALQRHVRSRPRW